MSPQPPPLKSPDYSAPYDSSIPLPTSRPPPTRQPTKSGGHGRTTSLKRGKTLTRPERQVAQAPLINPPATLPAYPGGPAAEAPATQDSKWGPWSIFAHAVTFWAPPFILASLGGMKDQPSRQAWREKVALCFIALLLGGIVGFATVGLDRALCPPDANQNLATFVEVGSTNGTLSLSGHILNTTQSFSQQADFNALSIQSPGQDITNLFRRSASDFKSCRGLTFAAATDDPCANSQFCILDAPTKTTLNNYKLILTDKQTGYDWDLVANLTAYMVIDGMVLNLTPYLLAHPNAIANDQVDIAIRTVLTSGSKSYGKDATRLFYQRETLKAAVPCLTERYYAGAIDKVTPGCFISQLFLYVSLVVILGVVMARFAMACIFNWFLSARLAAPPKNLSRTVISPAVMPEGANLAVDNKNGTAPWAGGGQPVMISGGKKLHKGNVYRQQATSPNASSTTLVASASNISPNSTKPAAQPLITMAQIGAELFTVCLVTCYSEGEDSLRTTCDSISVTDYSDHRKLLFIVADGIITGEGEKMSTPDICVSLLDQDPRFGTPTPMGYIAVGNGAKKENRALVYAGHYSKHSPCILS